MYDVVKKSLGHLIAIGVFLVLVLVYFAPSVIDGKSISQGDMLKYSGMSQELEQYYQKEDKGSAWTGSMFSGMPSYHIAVYGTPPNFLTYVEKVFKSIDYLGASIVFTALICFYLLMCVMGVKRWLAIAGSVAFAFASYNIIIIMAGHITKAYVIAYMPLTLAGMVLLFRNKLLWGSVLFTLGVALSVMNNHVQITYYLAIFCLFVYLGYAVGRIREKAFLPLLKTSGILAVCVILAVLPNLGNLYSNYEVAQESMRGPSELTAATTGNEGKASGGLDKDYAFEWSYGKSELLTLMIPNAYGGETGGTLDNTSELYRTLKSKGAQLGKDVQTYTYWGNQLFTSGPVYFGALVCFLFVLGMFVIRNPMKWWIAGGSLFFVFLALGRNLDWFNDIMFHYLPMYNKFRTPSMALVIPGMTFPFIACWGVSEILSGKTDKALFKRGMTGALAITGGLSLIVWIVPGLLLGFRSAMDAQYQLPEWYYNALLADRASLAQADALRSLVFILLGAALLYVFQRAADKAKTAPLIMAGLAVLVLADLWPVDKRYLSQKDFVPQKPYETYAATAADKEILKDTDPSYRVLNLNNPFQETNTSFYHKSIGGYHAAKLRRYQELIDHRLSGEIRSVMDTLRSARSESDLEEAFKHTPSLNMLNTRYVIFNPGQAPVKNPYAMGNAWFVGGVEIAKNADEEIAMLDRIDPRRTAAVDVRFKNEVRGMALGRDSASWIKLVSYKPDELVYQVHSSDTRLAVFSEIYYPHGWKAYIDGKPAPHFRADWILRGMLIPEGDHTVEFKFIPDGYNTANRIASVSSGIIFLLLLAAIGYSLSKAFRRKEEE